MKRSLPEEETSRLERKRERCQSDHQNNRLFLFHDTCRGPRFLPDPVESGLTCYSTDTFIVGSINGLICSAGTSGFHYWPSPDDIWLWNPSTGLSKKLPIGNHTFTRFTNTQVTFAFCWDETADVYKVVKIVSKKCEATFAEVWTSNSDSWKDIIITSTSTSVFTSVDGQPCFYHPTYSLLFAPATHCDVFVQTSPYWVVLDYADNVFAASFDIKTDELKLFPFPPQLSLPRNDLLLRFIRRDSRVIVTSLEGCLAVLDFLNYFTYGYNNFYKSHEYDLWTMDYSGKWSKRSLVYINFDFSVCLNTIGGKLALREFDGIKLFDLVTKETQVIHGVGRSSRCVVSTFDFVLSSVSMEGFEPFGDDFSSLINLILPSGLQINLNPNAPWKRIVRETEEDTNSAEEMEDDPDEVDIICRLWESQWHLQFSPPV
ncbi:F-box/kelch-repeat protein at3g06240 [Phtheirospermum japonicum]|uniref:F-box/kelch-repeat protein at3g06240 n=1 Tax=Phtheirospermum japonicum TaxID=374723 RepID=A0A830D563_9LAMI|nr:F-box/kelch-repeat protein at3g06240 [Phtheirospermum japonicum]